MRRLHELGEYALRAARMQKGHAASADPGARTLVDQPKAGAPDLIERRVDVLDSIGNVVHPGAVLLEEASDCARGIGGPEKLDVASADLEEDGLDRKRLDGLAVLLPHPQPIAVELDRAFQVVDRDADVIDRPEQGAAV